MLPRIKPWYALARIVNPVPYTTSSLATQEGWCCFHIKPSSKRDDVRRINIGGCELLENSRSCDSPESYPLLWPYIIPASVLRLAILDVPVSMHGSHARMSCETSHNRTSNIDHLVVFASYFCKVMYLLSLSSCFEQRLLGYQHVSSLTINYPTDYNTSILLPYHIIICVQEKTDTSCGIWLMLGVWLGIQQG